MFERKFEAEVLRFIKSIPMARNSLPEPNRIKFDITISVSVLMSLAAVVLFYIGHTEIRLFYQFSHLPPALFEQSSFADTVARGWNAFFTILNCNEYSKKYEHIVYVRIFYSSAMAYFLTVPIILYRSARSKNESTVALATAFFVGVVILLSCLAFTNTTATLSAEIRYQSKFAHLLSVHFKFVPRIGSPEKHLHEKLDYDLEAENEKGHIKLIEHCKDGCFVSIAANENRKSSKYIFTFIDKSRIESYDIDGFSEK